MKCSKCGAELTGKFCTNCGAPAPENPVCSKCGAELTGKFCTKCGTPALQGNPITTETTQTQSSDLDSTSGTQTEQTAQNDVEPVQYDPSQFDNTKNDSQPVQYDQTQPNQTSYGQQFTNQPKAGYTGQQFTNQPQQNMSNGKKPMSGGKLAAIIISIVVGLILILGIIIGIIACNIVKGGTDIINSAISEYSNYSSILDDSVLDDYSDLFEDDSSSEDNTEKLDPVSHCYYEETDGGVKITAYDNYYDYETAKITVNIPSQIDGKDVVEIEELWVYDNDSTENGYIKIIIPGTVKVIDSYAMSFCEDINEVVIEDGLTTIEPDAFKGCKDLEKITIPESVTMMDDCGFGLEVENYEYKGADNDAVIYGKKGSTAESYAKENGIKFVQK